MQLVIPTLQKSTILASRIHRMYVVDAVSISSGDPLGSNVDSHPLYYPYDLENDRITLPAPPTPTPSPTIEVVNESSPSDNVLTIAVSAAIVIVAVGLIYYQRKRKTIKA